LPHLYVGAEDVVLKPLWKNLLSRDAKGNRARILRDEMGPWLYDYLPGVAIGATHSIAGVGPKVGEWPLIPGHMGVHNWEYVGRAR